MVDRVLPASTAARRALVPYERFGSAAADRTPPGSTAHSRVTQVLVRLLSIAPTDALADTFTIAGIIGVQVPPGQVATAINRFADLCVRNPTSRSVTDYAFGREIRSATFADLTKLLAADNAPPLRMSSRDAGTGRHHQVVLSHAGSRRRHSEGEVPTIVSRYCMLLVAVTSSARSMGSDPSGVVLRRTPNSSRTGSKYSGQIGPEMGQWLSDNIEDGLRLPRRRKQRSTGRYQRH